MDCHEVWFFRDETVRGDVCVSWMHHHLIIERHCDPHFDTDHLLRLFILQHESHSIFICRILCKVFTTAFLPSLLILLHTICSLTLLFFSFSPFLIHNFSNLFSIILIIGNPTNVIACEGTHLCTFFGYMIRMIIPALLGGATALGSLYFYFRHDLPSLLPQLDLRPSEAIQNRMDAIISSCITLLCLLIMSISSFLPGSPSLWIIAVAFGIITLCKDLIFEAAPRFCPSRIAAMFQSHPLQHIALFTSELDHHVDTMHSGNDEVEMTTFATSQEPLHESGEEQHPDHDSGEEQHPDHDSAAVLSSGHPSDHRVIQIVKKLPHKVLPFITGMFIIVEILNHVGLIDLIASWLAPLCTTIWSSVFVIGISSTIMCNLVNNQPMTIFFTRILLSPFFNPGDEGRQGALYSLIVGSNLGADFTLIGALAGLMWRSILNDKGVRITYGQFFKTGIIVMTLPLVVIFLTLVAVLYLF